MNEHFDANQVALAGTITRIWARGADIYARLDARPADEDNSLPTALRATLRLAGGQINGQEVTLLKGDRVRVLGYLADSTLDERLEDFLKKAGKLDWLKEMPELAATQAQARRNMTCLIPESLERLSAPAQLNTARLEGVVVKCWDFNHSRFARLAVYDKNTRLSDEIGKNGLPRRTPHYVNIFFPQAQVGGREILLHAKERIRVSGQLVDRPYSEELRTFLLDAKQAEVLSRLPNSDDVAELRIRRSSGMVQVEAMIVFSR